MCRLLTPLLTPLLTVNGILEVEPRETPGEPRKNALEARVGIGQENPKNKIKMPNVYGPINHLLKYSTTFRWMPDTDDFTDGGLRWFRAPTSATGGESPPRWASPGTPPGLASCRPLPSMDETSPPSHVVFLHRLALFLGLDSHSHWLSLAGPRHKAQTTLQTLQRSVPVSSPGMIFRPSSPPGFTIDSEEPS